jgi:DNA-directed RNA polymerase subunit RPC12/RpoP
MRNTKCDDCGRAFPVNETFKIIDGIFCRSCGEKLIKSRKDIRQEQIQRQFDATVCVNCGKDNGDAEFARMAGLPTCEECIKYFRNRPYPMWIRAAMVGLFLIVIFSFVWNERFICGYVDLRNANAAANTGDFKTTAKLFHSASARVPEAKYLSSIASFYEGVCLLSEDKSSEALERFNRSKPGLPAVWPVDEMIMNAKIGIAFDNKDYDEFLALSQKVYEKNPRQCDYVAMVASAYACKYAVSGDEQFKQQSLDFLKKAKTMSERQGFLKEYNEYSDRILHRIATREIIDREEFNKRFPNGWQNQQKEQGK